MSTVVRPEPARPPRASGPRFVTLRMLLRSPAFIVGALIVAWWVV